MSNLKFPAFTKVSAGKQISKVGLVFLLLTMVGLVSAAVVYAYVGTHNFLEMTTTTADGHVYKSEYLASGSFSFDGAGGSDGSNVNLKGTLNVYEIDGELVSETYCTKLRGTLSASGGELLAIRYTDPKCRNELDSQKFIVLSYSEDSDNNFTIVAQDETGVESTTIGLHSFKKKGSGKK